MRTLLDPKNFRGVHFETFTFTLCFLIPPFPLPAPPRVGGIAASPVPEPIFRAGKREFTSGTGLNRSLFQDVKVKVPIPHNVTSVTGGVVLNFFFFATASTELKNGAY